MKENIDLELMWLIRATENRIKRAHKSTGNHTHGTGRILSALTYGTANTQTELAQLLDIRPQSLTRILTEMEQKGYIVRQRDEKDKRNVSVMITEEGSRLQEEISEKRRLRAEVIFSKLDDAEKEQLRCLLKKVAQDKGEDEHD